MSPNPNSFATSPKPRARFSVKRQLSVPNPNPNRTRDHLANERTYLAWMRTAIALIGFGLVVVRLRYALPGATPGPLHAWQIGLLFCLTGLGAVVFATAHYFHIQHAIERDEYQPEKGWIWACSLTVIGLGAGVIWYVLSASSGGR